MLKIDGTITDFIQWYPERADILVCSNINYLAVVMND